MLRQFDVNTTIYWITFDTIKSTNRLNNNLSFFEVTSNKNIIISNKQQSIKIDVSRLLNKSRDVFNKKLNDESINERRSIIYLLIFTFNFSSFINSNEKRRIFNISFESIDDKITRDTIETSIEKTIYDHLIESQSKNIMFTLSKKTFNVSSIKFWTITFNNIYHNQNRQTRRIISNHRD